MRIEIQDYNPNWPAQFDELRAFLEKVIGLSGAGIEHIGSTSVPGLAAKPIVDILVGIPPNTSIDDPVAAILSDPHWIYIPYWEAQMPFRRFFIRFDRTRDSLGLPDTVNDETVTDLPVAARNCHVHLVATDNPFYAEHIRFRDILRNDSKVCREYEILKKGLAERIWASSAEYAAAKSDFIRTVLDD